MYFTWLCTGLLVAKLSYITYSGKSMANNNYDILEKSQLEGLTLYVGLIYFLIDNIPVNM